MIIRNDAAAIRHARQYLNSLPNSGQGHTDFPDIGLSVRPIRGRAVLFCNVNVHGDPEPRVKHRACPVEGEHRKFGMNVWITDVSLQGLALLPVKYKAKEVSRGGGDSAAMFAGLIATAHFEGSEKA